MDARREYIASYPAGVLAIRYTVDTPGQLALTVSTTRAKYVLSQNASVLNSGNAAIDMQANSGQDVDPIVFNSEIRVALQGGLFQLNSRWCFYLLTRDAGNMTSNGTAIKVTGATTVDLFYDAESSVRFDTEAEWVAEMKSKLDAAVSQGYDALKEEAITDSSELLERVSLDLGESPTGIAELPTDFRLYNYRNVSADDVQLFTLMYNYGRHLLAASSRTTSSSRDLPANLQGIWCDTFSPPWGGKYTIDINIQMNYWAAQSANLAETFEPLADLIDVAVPRGQSMAQRVYGCNGTMFHHNLDLWGDPAITDNGTEWSMWPMGAAWLTQHLMEHYRFTLDETFLQERAWPVLTQVAEFYYCYLFEHFGYYVTGPTISPENGFYVPDNMTTAGVSEGIDIDPSMDRQLLWELFNNIIEIADILGVTDNDDVNSAKDFLSKIPPIEIGSYGQILEWRIEYSGGTGNRHLSPLWGLHPGRQMTPIVNQTLADAGNVLLQKRIDSGSGSTGWSRTWMINLFARLFDGDGVWEHMGIWMNIYPYNNLFNTDHGPGTAMQIDGNFGFLSGLTEALLQSHAGVIHVLPAAPSGVSVGSVTGLVARGNVVVDIAWEDGKLTNATLYPKNDGTLSLLVSNSTSFQVDGQASNGMLSVTGGSTYSITLA